MPNKTRNWTDVELIMSSVSIALTLGFWGLFASKQKVGANVLGEVSLVSAPGTTTASAPIPTTLVPGQVVYFGAGAATPQAPGSVATQTQVRHRGGGGGSSGGGSGGAKTGSSHP